LVEALRAFWATVDPAAMLRLLCFCGALLATHGAVIGRQSSEVAAVNQGERQGAAARLTEILRAARPSALLQKIVHEADPKLDEDLPVVHVGPTTDKEIKELIDKEQDAAWERLQLLVYMMVIYFATIFALAGCYSYLWKDPPMDVEAATPSDEEDFKFGICNFFEDLHVCCLSFFCLPCRWADTMNASGILGFWAAFTLFIVVAHLRSWAQNFDIVLGLIAWLAAALVFAYYRQQLRKLFSMRNEPLDKAKDVALWACCCCCAAVQEARQVRTGAVQEKKIEA